jgi:glycerol kinase
MDVLCRFQADLLGVPVRRPANQETTALGAAYLAGLAEGVWSGRDEIARMWRAAATYEPVMSRDEADSRHAEWQRALERARGWAAPDGRRL